MNTYTRLISLALILAFVLSACAAGAQPGEVVDTGGSDPMMETKDDEMMEEDKDDSMMEEDKDDSMMEENKDDSMMEEGKDDSMMEEGKDDSMMEEGKDDAMMTAPDFFSAGLVDARTGETFQLNDFKGKVVLVENLAMWCSTCKRQQMEVQALHKLLGERDDFVSLGLDIDPNENQAALKDYIERNGFDWLYAIAPPQVSSEIGALYGAQFLNPPSAPMFVIDRHGEVHLLPFGVKSAEQLNTILKEYLDEGM